MFHNHAYATQFAQAITSSQHIVALPAGVGLPRLMRHTIPHFTSPTKSGDITWPVSVCSLFLTYILYQKIWEKSNYLWPPATKQQAAINIPSQADAGTIKSSHQALIIFSLLFFCIYYSRNFTKSQILLPLALQKVRSHCVFVRAYHTAYDFHRVWH